MVRPLMRRDKDLRKRPNTLGKKLLKKAINNKRNVRRPHNNLGKATPGSQNRPGGAVRKTKTATEAASGAQRGWRKLYVGDLAKNTSEHDIRNEFGKFGEINTVWIARNPPGFAFVDFMESRDAARALRVLDGSNRLGPKIKVEFAKKLGPRNASLLAAMKDKRDSGRPAERGRRRRFSDTRGSNSRRIPSLSSPPLSSFSAPWSRGRTPPGRMTPPRRRSPMRRYSPRRSPSPLRRGNYPPPPLPPLPSMFDPYDPRFREMALMGGWSRGRSPLMAPPPPPPPRYRSRSPSPRYRGRSPPPRRSPGRRNRGSHKRRNRDSPNRYAAASLVYPPLSLPPPSFVDLGDMPPLHMTPPPRGRSPPPVSRRRSSPSSRYPPSSRGSHQRGRSPMRHSPSPLPPPLPPQRSKRHSPAPYRRSSSGRSRTPPRKYSPGPPEKNSRSYRRTSRDCSPQSRNYPPPPPSGRSPPPPPPRGYGNNHQHWSPPPPMRQHSPSPMRSGRSPPSPAPMRRSSHSRSPMRTHSPPRPRSPPPKHRSRSWSPPPRKEIPKAYSSPPRRERTPTPRSSRSHVRAPRSPPAWGDSPPRPRSPDHRPKSPVPRGRSPPVRQYRSPPRGKSPPRHRNSVPYSQRSPRSRSPLPSRHSQMGYPISARR